MAKQRTARNDSAGAGVPAREPVSAGRQRFVAIWTKAWGLVGAVVIVFIAARLPETLRAGEAAGLLRDFGLGLVCLNLVLQAMRPNWPIVYALPMTVFGITLWLIGFFA